MVPGRALSTRGLGRGRAAGGCLELRARVLLCLHGFSGAESTCVSLRWLAYNVRRATSDQPLGGTTELGACFSFNHLLLFAWALFLVMG